MATALPFHRGARSCSKDFGLTADDEVRARRLTRHAVNLPAFTTSAAAAKSLAAPNVRVNTRALAKALLAHPAELARGIGSRPAAHELHPDTGGSCLFDPFGFLASARATMEATTSMVGGAAPRVAGTRALMRDISTSRSCGNATPIATEELVALAAPSRKLN